MISYSVLTFNNQVGIVTDAVLLTDLLRENITTNVDMKFIHECDIKHADVGIWIQNFDVNLLNLFKKNIFYINEEWAGECELSNLHLFDHVICKSTYAYNLLKQNKNVIYLPFISKDMYVDSLNKEYDYLHFMGRSTQKNTELILKQNVNITLIDPYNRYTPQSNINHINSYQSNEQLKRILNIHRTHICCSLYESWGHYLFEGLSTGSEMICSDIPIFREQLDPDLIHFIPTQEKIDMSYMYCSDNKTNIYKLRKSFFIDEKYFTQYIENVRPIGKNYERRMLYNNIINKSKTQLISFFKNI